MKNHSNHLVQSDPPTEFKSFRSSILTMSTLKGKQMVYCCSEVNYVSRPRLDFCVTTCCSWFCTKRFQMKACTYSNSSKHNFINNNRVGQEGQTAAFTSTSTLKGLFST